MTLEKPLNINYYGYFTPFGGYGIANLNWVKHLRRQDVGVSVHAKFQPQPRTHEWDVLTDEEKSIFTQDFRLQRIGIVETNPFDFESNISEFKIANTMCESDHVGKDWPDKLNAMQLIITPNEFNKIVFEDSGVKTPVVVLPHGVDVERFTYYDRPARSRFTFGMVGYFDQHDRKGAFDVIRAFISEFDNGEDVQLLLKSSDPSFLYYSQYKDPRIMVVAENLPVPALNELYHMMDCFVFPSKAEGIGYPPREAMLTGLPVILTQWSGLTEIAKPEVSYPLIHYTLKPRYNFIEQDGNWAVNDIQEIMYYMRYVYENRDEAKLKGKKASSHLRAKYSWDRCTKQLISLLKTL